MKQTSIVAAVVGLADRTDSAIKYIKEKVNPICKNNSGELAGFHISEIQSFGGFTMFSDWGIKGTTFVSFSDLNSQPFKNPLIQKAFNNAFKHQEKAYLDLVEGEDPDEMDSIWWMDQCHVEYSFSLEYFFHGVKDRHEVFHEYAVFLVNCEFAISEGPKSEHYVLRDDLVLRMDGGLDDILSKTVTFVNNFFEKI